MLKLKCMSVKIGIFIIVFLLLPIHKSSAFRSISHINKDELAVEIEKIYNFRCLALTTGDYSTLSNYYDTSKPSGRYALDHEIKRVKYLKDWSTRRDMEFKKIESTVRIKKVIPSGNALKLILEESYKFDYAYRTPPVNPLNSFGVGIRHTASLIKKNNKWLILSDWYTDCFEDSLQSYTFNLNSNINSLKNTLLCIKNFMYTTNPNKKIYNREKAIAYADKYCGAAWGSGNNFKYNKKYDDYNGVGGDCTNFASQILGDKEGGSMRINDVWHPGTTAWANADGLKNYLLYSGRGTIIKIGTFNELTTSQPGMSNGIVNSLQLGDLIAYENGRGNIDHFGIVTGFDSHKYPLVNSHTTDRYHVPWDLGWGDKDIRFFLIHINDY
ncbi:amidase domain-containing protein [Clostridium sp. WILCCON 0269]|uniref:Amidase domain-containing protein n=1 Tax=Candidatus Clostridium eludens TaxID=3381663 RepID=A0ABW8SS68_9CLOT